MYTIIGGDGKEYGPVSAQQMRTWLKDGRANLDTQVRVAGGEWRRLADYPEFTAPEAPPPPIPAAVGAGPAAAAAVDPQAVAQDLIARAGRLDVFGCYERSWGLLKANFFPLSLAVLLLFLVEGALGAATTFHPLTEKPNLTLNWGGALLAAVLKGGLYVYFLKRMRGQPASFGDLFAGFSLAFLPLLLVGIFSGVLVGLAFLLLILPGIYLGISYVFAIPLIVDRRLPVWEAMEVSRKVITSQWWRIFGLILLGVPLMFLGLACLLVGILPAIALSYGALLFAYEDLCNPGRASAPPPGA